MSPFSMSFRRSVQLVAIALCLFLLLPAVAVPQTSPSLPSDEVVITTQAGGSLTSSDSRIQAIFPPGAVDRAVRVRYQPRPDRVGAGVLYAFTLEAGPDDGSSLGHWSFAQPVSLQVHFRAAEASRGAEQMRLMAWDEAAGAWIVIPTELDQVAGTLTGLVHHFSDFGITTAGPSYGTDVPPSLRAFSTDLWTGAATVQYPLLVPAGPAGFSINPALAYNSQGANILNHVAGTTYVAQAPWVGFGWELVGLGSISRPVGKYGPYHLSFGGGTFELRDNGGTLTTYPQGFLKVAHSGGLTWNTQPWYVWTPDGAKYTFGNTSAQLGSGVAYEAFWTDWNQGCETRVYQWGLTKVEDTLGNRWDIS